MNHLQDEKYVEEEEIDLFAYFQSFWKRKWDILLIINCVVVFTLVYTLWMADEMYESQATIMPYVKSSGSSALTALKSMVPSGLVPLPVSQGEEDINRFINILKSRTIAEGVVQQLDLVDQLYPDVSPADRPTFQEVVGRVKSKLVQAKDNQIGLVQVTAQANSAQLAADIANAYVQNLRQYLTENTVTQSRRNRIFTEEQYQKALHDLQKAERQLQAFKEKYKLFSISDQTEEIITRLGTLKGNLMAKEAELNISKRSGVSENNPQYKMLNYEIEELKRQIAEMEKGTGSSTELASVALEALPELERELAQLMREKTVQETLYALLAQQYEQAKLAEASDEINFLTLDAAIPPLLRVKPHRALNLVLGAMLGGMLAVAYVIGQIMLEAHRNRRSTGG